MPSLKDLKNRIGSVKNTRKITKAMQMVAAAKLRRAQEAAEAARPYASRMAVVVAGVMTAVSLAADGGDSCVAYINGTKHTDEAIVMAQMHSTMDEMAQQAQELSVERQMDNFFVESFNN